MPLVCPPQRRFGSACSTYLSLLDLRDSYYARSGLLDRLDGDGFDWASLAAERKVGTKVKFAASLHYPVSTTRRMLSKKTACRGDEGKAVERRGVLTALLFEQRSSHTTAQAQRSKFKGFLPFVTAIASVFQYRRGS